MDVNFVLFFRPIVLQMICVNNPSRRLYLFIVFSCHDNAIDVAYS